MDNLSKTLSLAGPCKQSRKLTIALLVLLAICLSGRGAEAKYGGGSNTMASAETSTYVFVPDQSAVVQTGGIAGVHETYSIEGQFRLIIDFDTGMASFDQVDANLVDESPFLPTQSLGELFNMAALVGTVVDETTIEFEGKTADGTNTNILLRLIFRDDSVHLTGRTVPPPKSADFFIYELDAVAWKKYGSGTGEANGPYLIYTAEQMNAISSEPNDWDKHFKLMADIDLSGFDGNEGRLAFNIIAPDTDAVKWGFQGTPFRGTFDGNSHTISNLIISGGDFLGLFGRLNSGAVVKDLGVVDVNITGSSDYYVGGLVGSNGSGNVIRCYSTGTVSGDRYVGVLVGWNYGDVTHCYSTGSVNGSSFVGGLVGSNSQGSLLNCYSTGVVSGERHLGGLAGINRGDVTHCYSTGAVSGTVLHIGGLVGENIGAVTHCYSTSVVRGGDEVGGLVGLNWGAVSRCYSTGTVSGGNDVGGLVGQNGGDATDCYSTAAVNGNWYVGGLAGSNRAFRDVWDGTVGTISKCYSSGGVTAENRMGGLIGYNDGETLNSLWDTDTSGQSRMCGSHDIPATRCDDTNGKTTAQMQMARTFTKAGWDFVGETENGTEDIWWILEGQDYPRLWWELDEEDYSVVATENRPGH